MVSPPKSIVNYFYTGDTRVQLRSNSKLCPSLFSSFYRKEQRVDDEMITAFEICKIFLNLCFESNLPYRSG